MPHFFIRQATAFLGTIPQECQAELLFAIQDTISLQLDCPMVRVTYSTDMGADPSLVDHDVVVTVCADSKVWNRLYDSKAEVIRVVKNVIFRKLTGAIADDRILVKTITSTPSGRTYR